MAFGRKDPQKDPLCILIGPGRSLQIIRVEKRYGALISDDLECAWIAPNRQHTLFKPRFFGTSLPVLAEERVLILQREWDDPIDLSNPSPGLQPGDEPNGSGELAEDEPGPAPASATRDLCRAKKTARGSNSGTLCRSDAGHDGTHRYGRKPPDQSVRPTSEISDVRPPWRFPLQEESKVAEDEYAIEELFARNGRTEASGAKVESRVTFLVTLAAVGGVIAAAIKFFVSNGGINV